MADGRSLDALAHEMARRVGCSQAAARAALDELQKAGLVAVEARGVVLPMAPRCPIEEVVRGL